MVVNKLSFWTKYNGLVQRGPYFKLQRHLFIEYKVIHPAISSKNETLMWINPEDWWDYESEKRDRAEIVRLGVSFTQLDNPKIPPYSIIPYRLKGCNLPELLYNELVPDITVWNSIPEEFLPDKYTAHKNHNLEKLCLRETDSMIKEIK